VTADGKAVWSGKTKVDISSNAFTYLPNAEYDTGWYHLPGGTAQKFFESRRIPAETASGNYVLNFTCSN
jgi:hypothetical protein